MRIRTRQKWIAAALGLLVGFPVLAADPATKVETPDLTDLSLEELYNLDVMQINVLGGHTHPQGQIMFGYSFMHMNMEGYRVGTQSFTPAEVLTHFGYPVVHERMEMDMHMFEGMYALRNDLTFMAMIPYKEMTMDHLMADGHRFTQHSDGIGDVEVMGLYTALGDIRKGGHRLVLNGGISFPTGSVNVEDHRNGDPALPKVQLEYPMQQGSGTFDGLFGLTYLGDHGRWTWGAQTLETVRFGHNEAGFRYGNLYRNTGWAGYGFADWFAPYVRVEGRLWDNVHGRDRRLNPAANPEADPSKQGGERIDLLGGLTFYVPRGPLKGLRLIVEGGAPVYERLDGPQLSTDFVIGTTLSYSF